MHTKKILESEIGSLKGLPIPYYILVHEETPIVIVEEKKPKMVREEYVHKECTYRNLKEILNSWIEMILLNVMRYMKGYRM